MRLSVFRQRACTAASILFLALVLSPCMAARGQALESNLYIKTSDRSSVSLKNLLTELKKVNVVFIGEEHGNQQHHRAQLGIIKLLKESGLKVAVGTEMFRADVQPALDAWVEGELDVSSLFREFQRNWYLDYWPLSRDLFFYVRNEKIPFYGLNISPDIITRIQRGGVVSLEDEPGEGGLPAVSCAVDSKYYDLIKKAFQGQVHGNGSLEHFCEAQIMRDAAMAQNILTMASRFPGHVLVILSGNFHAWKHGIPARLAESANLSYRVLLFSADNSFLNYDIFLKEADYVLWPQ